MRNCDNEMLCRFLQFSKINLSKEKLRLSTFLGISYILHGFKHAAKKFPVKPL